MKQNFINFVITVFGLSLLFPFRGEKSICVYPKQMFHKALEATFVQVFSCVLFPNV